MARLNKAVKTEERTAGGGIASTISNYNQLRRLVLSCMLWEDNFYVDGQTVSEQIVEYARKVSLLELSQLSIETRTTANLRHVPLLLLAVLCERGRGNGIVADTIYRTVQRADEITEFLAVYAKHNGVTPGTLKKKLSAQAKKGLGRAFTKFDEYQLQKYNRDGAIKLRDALFLTHPHPLSEDQQRLWDRLVSGDLKTPDTWETALSAGKDKKATFTRLIHEGQLGYLAVLRNLRNMTEAGVDKRTIVQALNEAKGRERVLPWRFVAAARACPSLEPEIDAAFLANVSSLPKIPGSTCVVIDTSGSMRSKLSGKSDLTRMDAACALGAIAREMCENPTVYATAGHDGAHRHATALVPARRGMALIDAMQHMQGQIGGGGIFLNQVCQWIRARGDRFDRMIVITDEQDCSSGYADAPSNATPVGDVYNYMINVASDKNGIGYGKWIKIDGFSESVLRFIYEIEREPIHLIG